jgi:protein-tyrosine-phosphatase
MKQVKRVIFIGESGTSRAPMAAAIFRQIAGDDRIEVLARGIVVQFPEPLNQKTEAIMISNGIKLDEFEAVQLSEDDITEETLIFTMDESQRERVIRELERATEENTFVLSAFVGDELEIMDPYGGSLQSYGLCFEVIKRSIEKLLLKI